MAEIDEDSLFFRTHPDRYAHIREPRKMLVKLPSRAMKYVDESAGEFWSLGDHEKNRERILLWRVPESHPNYDPKEVQILRVPFLQFSDEQIEDTDAVLLPILHQIMQDAAKKQGYG
jgi:hypothetical protein